MRIPSIFILFLLLLLPSMLRAAVPAYTTTDLSIQPTNLLRSNLVDSATVTWAMGPLGRMTATAVPGSTQWTNFTVANSEGGIWKGVRDTNDVASFASTFLTNAASDFTTIMNLGYAAGGASDYVDAYSVVNLGEYAGNSASLTNSFAINNLGQFCGGGVQAHGCFSIFNLAPLSGQNTALTNVLYMINLGHLSGTFSEIQSAQELHNFGTYSGGYLLASNIFNIFNYGYAAAGGENGNFACRLTNVSGLFNYGYRTGARQTLLSSSNIYNYGTAAGSNSILNGSSAIYHYGKDAGREMRLTNCLNIYTFGTEAGTNIIMTAKTNVFLFGHVGAVAPLNNDYYYGGPLTRHIFQGTTTTLGAVTNQSVTVATNIFNGGWLDVVGKQTNRADMWFTPANSFDITGIRDLQAGRNIGWNSLSQMQSPGNGRIVMFNNGGTDFTRLEFGGSVAGFPALKREVAGLTLVGGDGVGTSTNNFIAAGSITATNGLLVPSASGLKLGTGTTITNILTGSANLNFPDTLTQTHSDLPITVTGATTNDAVQLAVPFQALMDGTCYTAFSSNDTVWVRFLNSSALSRNPPECAFRAAVTKW